MKKEVEAIAASLHDTLAGEPWFGRAVYDLLNEVDTTAVYKRPNENAHSMIDLLYHMITWATFTCRRLQGEKEKSMADFEKLDWREIDPAVHTWANGVKEFKTINDDIIALLKAKDDGFLNQIVDYRSYDFRHLLNGYIQHNIYHVGQVAYVNKLIG